MDLPEHSLNNTRDNGEKSTRDTESQLPKVEEKNRKSEGREIERSAQREQEGDFFDAKSSAPSPPSNFTKELSFWTKLKIELSVVNRFMKAFLSWQAIKHLFSHHPYCKPYESHVYKLGPVRICKGCILSYPPVYAVILIYILWPAAHSFFLTTNLLQNVWWFVIGFGILTFGSRFLGRFSIFIKDISKFARGAWTGFLVLVILTQHWAFKIVAGLTIISGMAYLSIHRGKDMERICHEECPWHAQYEICPGFGELSRRFDNIMKGNYEKDPYPEPKNDLPMSTRPIVENQRISNDCLSDDT